MALYLWTKYSLGCFVTNEHTMRQIYDKKVSISADALPLSDIHNEREIMNKIRKLLDESKLAIRKQEWIDNNNPKYNIIEVLRDVHDEVNLHSKVICSLIQKKDSISKKLLELFLDELEISDMDIDKTKVYREYNNIDILIQSDHRAIIIENKIFAQDQEKQLERYYNLMIEEGYEDHNIDVYYLTLTGTDVSAQSRGKLDVSKIKLISYRNNIENWINNCIEKVALYPTYRESLNQYMTIINKLIGRNEGNMEFEIRKEISKTVENLKSAKLIKEAYDSVRPVIQLKFWEELEKKFLERNYSIESNLKYTAKKVNDYYEKSRNNKFYGLMSEIHKIDKEFSLYLYIEIDHSIYWGYTIANQKMERSINNNAIFDFYLEKFDEIFLDRTDNLLDDYTIYDRSNYFLGGFQHTDGRMNFNQFTSDYILEMIEEINLKKNVEELISFIDSTTRMYQQNINR